MKKFIGIALICASLVGCSIFEKDVDPYTAGQIMGFTYVLTKEEMKEKDRKQLTKAYCAFEEVVTIEDPSAVAQNKIKERLFGEIDTQVEDVAQREMVKAIVQMYWTKVDAEYKLEIAMPEKQLSILREVRNGIAQAISGSQTTILCE